MSTVAPTSLRSVHSIHAERQALVARRAALKVEEDELANRIMELDASKDTYGPSYAMAQLADCERLYRQYMGVVGVDDALSLLSLHGRGALTVAKCEARYVPDVIWALLHCLIAEGKVPNV